MQIQHPTAILIARAATAQDDITGDGTTSNILIIGETLKQSEKYIAESVHPRILADGFELAKNKALEALDQVKLEKDVEDKELLMNVARTSLNTKLGSDLAEKLTDIVAESILTIKQPDKPIDLFMVEIQTMLHKSETDTMFVKGLVLDHGTRHPNMPKSCKNAYILTCNIGLEYEKSEVNAGTFYKSAKQRERMVMAERAITDERVLRIIELKKQVCKDGESFVVVNQNGIDPGSLDMFAKEGIMAMRRAKRRNMERLTLAAGGTAVNSVNALSPDVLGFAENVYEHVLGEDKYVFIEGVKNPNSCTILIKGPTVHSINQVKDAVRDGLRAVKNTIDDGCVIPGGGAFEVFAHNYLMKYKETVKGKSKLGIQAFADALLIIPKTLAKNSGFDQNDALIAIQEAQSDGIIAGLDLETGEPFDPDLEGVYDNYRVKRQQLHLSSILSSQLLLVDEIMAAGKSQAKQAMPMQ
eukprot:TRINITY_DN3317_c1_g1_i10.p1 TRINITY_DN3317_c1_g1~~TRINITY_DN3317_c1_g1_i10.p1  ORF type:complete len:470 (-),score=187.93 TRINITY_DN3317_c1_g1_i10:1174-2583(-)